MRFPLLISSLLSSKMLNQYIIFDGPLLLPCMFVGSLLFSVVASEIPLGSKLCVWKNDFWVSSNGDFSLGFFNHSDQPNLYSVGIRFNSDSIPPDKQAVVWVAGAEFTVSNHSYFQLTPQGALVLYDSFNGGVVWSSSTFDRSVSSAILRDDGNFVLLNQNEELVWQSFDFPSNTLLPGQNLSAHQTLRAASGSSVSSYYSLFLNDSGQLQLKWESSVIYWENGSPSNGKLKARLNSNGFFQLLDERSTPVWSAIAEDHNDDVRFRLLRLDVDGNLRMYSWDETSRSWRSVWQAVENQCDVFATCGNHGICTFANSSRVCKCPFRSRAAASLKCLAPYEHGCDAKVGMMTYQHTSLYGIYPPNDSVTITSLDQCQSLCLKDPLCTAVTYLNDGTARCRVKTTQYITGYFDPSLTSISYVKICLDPLAVLPSNPPSANPLLASLPSSVDNRSNKIPVHFLTAAVFSSVCVFFVLQIVVGLWLYKRRVISIRRQASSAFSGSSSAGLVRWTYAEIKELTGNFKHQLGPHSYKAMLKNSQPVVVKLLESPLEGRKFRATVSMVGSIYHKHLVKLEGYCCDPGHRYLVYEFVKNGSLEACLKNPKLCKRLTWRKRTAICLGVAKAISYLHTECREFISHGNLTLGNVSLDENLEAKVSEFGLGKLNIEASAGERAAEKDVGDFGKLILALITGHKGNSEDLCEWSYNKWISGYGWRVVDKRIEGEIDFEELERALRIAYWCLQADERMRPSMGEVVTVLEGTLSVDPPPPPFACQRDLHEEGLVESDPEP